MGRCVRCLCRLNSLRDFFIVVLTKECYIYAQGKEGKMMDTEKLFITKGNNLSKIRQCALTPEFGRAAGIS